MKHLSTKGGFTQYAIPGGIFLGVIGTAGLAWGLTGGFTTTAGLSIAFGILTAMFGASLALLAWNWLKARTQADRSAQAQATDQRERDSLQHRLDGMIRLNGLLIDAQSEDELIEKALEIISGVVGSTGASFVPYDEWGQPLRSYVFGSHPDSLLAHWKNHLASPEVRQFCQNCATLHGDSENGCPLIEGPFTDIVKITCLPLKRNNRTIGVVNLYLHEDQEIPVEINDYLRVMLNEMALALEITRLRNQELTSLRQVQLANSQTEELSTTLTKLIDGLRDVLDFKHARTVIKPAEPVFCGFDFISGADHWLSSDEAEGMINQTIANTASSDLKTQLQKRADGTGVMLLPIVLPEGTTIGVVLMTGAPVTPLKPRQTALIDTVTTQAALLVENERRRLDTEYRAVVQERMRLAREIHDSLAQTLAYLKLTSSQMQSQLAQGDLDRLAKTLQHSHEALSEAYLETRQAIDNLRLAPEQDVVSWLSQIIQNFEQASGLKVSRAIPDRLPQINPEIQVQLVRIVQEAFSNIRKHSQASNVWLTVHEWNGQLVLDLSDDGIGFAAEDVPEFSRHGLRGMRERVELIGAEFQITSQAGQGTSIHIEVPFQIQETAA